MINGARRSAAPDIGALLRDQAGRQVLLRVQAKGGRGRRAT